LEQWPSLSYPTSVAIHIEVDLASTSVSHYPNVAPPPWGSVGPAAAAGHNVEGFFFELADLAPTSHLGCEDSLWHRQFGGWGGGVTEDVQVEVLGGTRGGPCAWVAWRLGRCIAYRHGQGLGWSPSRHEDTIWPKDFVLVFAATAVTMPRPWSWARGEDPVMLALLVTGRSLPYSSHCHDLHDNVDHNRAVFMVVLWKLQLTLMASTSDNQGNPEIQFFSYVTTTSILFYIRCTCISRFKLQNLWLINFNYYHTNLIWLDYN
jgi:hypothetical protein